jgi:cell volume regulation protein A
MPGIDDGRLILAAGALLASALLASLVAGRLRVPGLLLFLAVGMLVGSDGLGLIDFDDYELARDIGIVALALILFEGGLASGWDEIRPVIRPAIGLATVGTLVTAGITGLIASWLFALSTLDGLLIGAILASTDGAAVFAVLRGSTLRRRLARTLEGEAGMNDPVAILLVLGVIELITVPGYGAAELVRLAAEQLVLGTVVGLAVGLGAARTLQRVRLASAGLYPVASLAAAALAFGGAQAIAGSGFLSVYLCGLVIGSFPSPAKRTITAFHDGLAWVAQLVLFLALGLLVFPGELGAVAPEGIVLAIVLVFVARVAGAFAGTAFSGFTTSERLALAWAGLRGGVPVVLATFPLIAEVEGSRTLFNVVFFAVVVSTILQGTTFEAVARRLGVTTTEAALPTPLIEASAVRPFGAEVVDHLVRQGDAAVGKYVRDLGLPREALLNVVIRDGQAFPPRGSTRLEAGDRLSVLVRQEVAVEFRSLLERWRSGPVGPEPRPYRLPESTVFSTGPWGDREGDPGRPAALDGVAIVERLRTRRDLPGAVVVLADGRYAFTGPVVAVGPRRAVQDAARRRLRHAANEAEQAWWREVIGALASTRG